MMNTLQRVSQGITAMLIHWPFYGALAFRLTLVETTDFPTAATDGKFFYINPAYAAKLTDRQLIGLMAHEVLHCAMMHFLRSKGRNHNLWNLACDYAIDHLIIAAGMEVPDATVNPEWFGWSAEMIYNALMKDKSKQKQARDEVVAPKPGEQTQELQEGWREAVIAAAAVAKGRGKMPGNLNMMIEDLTAPTVDWMSELLRFMQQAASEDYNWMSPNRRYLDTGFIMPSMRSVKMGPLVIGNDVSGSLWSPKAQSLFASEISAAIDACKPEVTYLVHCDTRIRGVETIEDGDDIDFAREGGGGTFFEPVFDWVAEQESEPACLVYLTDLEGSFPSEPPPYPVLWASCKKRVSAPFGETLYVDA